MTLNEYRQMVINAVACPLCGAMQGERCGVYNAAMNKISVQYVHDDRSAAYHEKINPPLPPDCADVHPKFGQCTQEAGHDDEHYTAAYEDPRRPDGSHPWDY